MLLAAEGDAVSQLIDAKYENSTIWGPVWGLKINNSTKKIAAEVS